jgi:hypothetical protein
MPYDVIEHSNLNPSLPKWMRLGPYIHFLT